MVPNRRKGDAARKKAQTEEPAGRCVVENTGIQSLLDKAVSDIGLMGPLSTVFPDDWRRILTCAYYLVSEGGALRHVDQWQRTLFITIPFPACKPTGERTPCKDTPTLQQFFFCRWIDINRQKEGEFMTELNELDSTCGVSDEELTKRFHEAVRIDNEIKKIKGMPIAKFDKEKKLPYLEYPDGRIEYA